MKAPTFGGGTLRTEFEVLAGVPMAAIPHLRFPYLQLHSKFLPSIVNVVHNNGYRALAVHPNDPSLESSKFVSRHGFRRVLQQRGFPR